MAASPQNVILMDVYNDADLCELMGDGGQTPPPALLKPPSSPSLQDFVTVVSVEDTASPPPESDNFVTVLEVNECSPGSIEEVLVYRLPGERLGMALKFVGGTTPGDNVSRVFIQSITPESPASRAQWKVSPIREGDEILEIGESAVTSMTRLDCVTLLRDSPVCIKLLLRHQGEAPGRTRKNPPPPIPPRKSSIGNAPGELPLTSSTSVRQHVELFEKHASGLERSPSLKRPSIPPPLPPRRPKSSCSDTEDQTATTTPAFPGMSLSMRLPGWEELMRKRGGDKTDRPVQPDLYVDLLAEEEKKLLECESDDTGSSVSTVIEKFSRASTANSSFSEHSRQQSLDRPSHTFDLEKVLSPFEQLERELDGQEETCVDDEDDGDQDLDFVDDPGILNDGKDALCDVLGLPSALAPPESFQDLSSTHILVNGDILRNGDTERRSTLGEDQDSRSEILSPLEEQEEIQEQDVCMESTEEQIGSKDTHAAAAMALDKLLQLECPPVSPAPRTFISKPNQLRHQEPPLQDPLESLLDTQPFEDEAAPVMEHTTTRTVDEVEELLSFARVVKTTQQCSSSTVISVSRNGILDSHESRTFFSAHEQSPGSTASKPASEFLTDRTVIVSSLLEDHLCPDIPLHAFGLEEEDVIDNALPTFQSSASVFLSSKTASSNGRKNTETLVAEEATILHRSTNGLDDDGNYDDNYDNDQCPSVTTVVFPVSRYDEHEEMISTMTSQAEDVVMEARLLDSPSGVGFGTSPRKSPLLDEDELVFEDCRRDRQILVGIASDIDTIPEEETSSATSELSTESSHLESDKSELEDASCSESPQPQDVDEDVFEDDCKAEVTIELSLGQTKGAATPIEDDRQLLSPGAPEAASPFGEREEKARTPDSEDPMSSDEGGYPSLLLRRLPPDGHEFPTAYSEPSLPKDAPSEDPPLKKPSHVYEDSGIFSDDPLSSLSASEGEEKTKVTATKSTKEGRQCDSRAASGAAWTNGSSSEKETTPPPSPLPAETPDAGKEESHPATFASTPLSVPLAQYSLPLMPDRRASAEATQKRYSGMLASMLETTKFGTKLKGLVIPDKPSTPTTLAKTLPVIVSNSVPTSNRVVLIDDAKPKRDCKQSPPTKHTALLADPPWKGSEISDVPKYSPAFKRRSLQVSKSVDGSPLRPSAQNGFQFSLTHSKPVTPVLPETPVMSPPPLSYTSSGTRSRSNSSSSTFSNPSSSGCSLETTKKNRLDPFVIADVEQKQPVVVATEAAVANGTSYAQSPLLERYLSSSSYEGKNGDAKVIRQGSVKSASSTESRTEPKPTLNGDVPSSRYSMQRKNSGERKRLSSASSTDTINNLSTTVSTSSSPPLSMRSPKAETKCDESKRPSRTWEVSSLKDSKTKFRSMDDRNWNSQFRRHSYEQPAYSVRVNSSSSLILDQKTRSLDSKESPSEVWQKSVRASQLGQQKTVLKKSLDSADSAKSFKALAQKWEQRSQDTQVGFLQPVKKEPTAVNGRVPAALAPKLSDYKQAHNGHVNGKASGPTSIIETQSVQLRTQKLPHSRPASMYEERDKPRLSPEWTESQSSSYLRNKPERPATVAYRSSKNAPSLSVNDIKKAFESEVAKVPPRTLASLRAIRAEQQMPMPEHRRFSSVDSNDSGNSTASREQYSSMTSLASTSSLISPQELQQLIDEANQSLDEAGASGHDIHVVILHKDSPTSGVGVTLAGGSDYETKEITVHKVISGGLADRDGRIRKSDRILSINGKTMKNVTHKDAIDILKSPRQEVVLVISRDGRQSVRTTPNISRASSLSSVLDVVDEPEVTATAATESQQTPVPVKNEKIVLIKDGLGLGFTLEGGKDSPLGDKPLVIKRIFRGGAAERDGRLQVGNELISINSHTVCSMTRTEAWNFLKKLPDGPLTLEVSRRAS